MENQPPEPAPDKPNPALQLQRDIHLQVVDLFRTTLPGRPDDTPDAIACRERFAIAEVAAMLPANAHEAALAAHCVAAGAQANDAMREITLHPGDIKVITLLRNQAASMMRQSRGFSSLLLRVQAARHKREAKDSTRETDALTEYSVRGLLTQAHESLPPPEPRPAPAAATPERSRYAPWEPDPSLSPEEAAKAERQELMRRQASRYAVLHTMRVKLIRQLKGLPENCDFEPPEPDLLDAIINGDSSNLRWADRYEPWIPPDAG
jgi:plasmid stability protein